MNWQNILSVQTLSRVAGAVAIIIAIIRMSTMNDMVGGVGWLIVGAGLLAWPTLAKRNSSPDA